MPVPHTLVVSHNIQGGEYEPVSPDDRETIRTTSPSKSRTLRLPTDRRDSSSSFLPLPDEPATPAAQSDDMGSPHGHTPRWIQIGYFVTLVAFFIYVTIDIFTTKRLYRVLGSLFNWITEHYFLGPLVFVGVVILFALLCIPESVLTVGGGYIFSKAHGPIVGVVLCIFLVYIGAMVGSISTFLVARHLLGETVNNWARRYRLLQAIDRSLEENGAKMIFLLRLSPIIPFNVANYLLGVTTVSFRDFCVGSMLGSIPWIVGASYIGSAVNGIEDVLRGGRGANPKGRMLRNIGFAVGAVATALVVYLLARHTKRAFDEVLQESENTESHDPRSSQSSEDVHGERDLYRTFSPSDAERQEAANMADVVRDASASSPVAI